MRILLLLLITALFCGRAHGSIFLLDGYAKIQTAFADSKLIILCKNVSDSVSPELIGLDAQNGHVLWRHNIDSFLYRADSDNSNEFYAVTRTNLVCRKRSDGTPLWTLNLSALDWPKKDKLYRDELSFYSLYDTNHVAFYMPLLNQDFFFISRTDTIGSLCVTYASSYDWALISRSDRQIIQTGKGEFLASAGSEILTYKFGFSNSISLVTSAKVSDISQDLTRKLNNWDTDPPYNMQYNMQARRNTKRYCTFAIRQKKKNETSVFYNQRVIYDTKKHLINILKPPSNRIYQIKWANTDEYIVRFPECVTLQTKDDRYKPASQKFLIESYSTDGMLKGKLIIPFHESDAPRSSRYLRFCGITQNGLFAFVDYTYISRDNAFFGNEGNVRLLLIDPSVPRITKSIDLASGSRTSANVTIPADTNSVIQILGNTDIIKMDVKSQDHIFTIRLISLSDGSEIWRHDEPVVIKKIKRSR